MKTIIFFFIILTIAFGEKFDGYILDKESGNPIPNVDVILSSKDQLITVSNLDGYFYLDLENNKNDSIIFNHLGYKNKRFLY